MSEPSRYLGIYLNDHLAGAAAGVRLAKRLHESNEGDATLEQPLAEIRAEIEADRTTLEAVMGRLGIRRGRIKPALAAAGEKLGRLKPNGRLSSYSPLSRLIELEALVVGVSGKLQLWRALERSLGADLRGFDFTELAARADRQRRLLEELHGAAAASALRRDTARTEAR